MGWLKRRLLHRWDLLLLAVLAAAPYLFVVGAAVFADVKTPRTFIEEELAHQSSTLVRTRPVHSGAAIPGSFGEHIAEPLRKVAILRRRDSENVELLQPRRPHIEAILLASRAVDPRMTPRQLDALANPASPIANKGLGKLARLALDVRFLVRNEVQDPLVVCLDALGVARDIAIGGDLVRFVVGRRLERELFDVCGPVFAHAADPLRVIEALKRLETARERLPEALRRDVLLATIDAASMVDSTWFDAQPDVVRSVVLRKGEAIDKAEESDDLLRTSWGRLVFRVMWAEGLRTQQRLASTYSEPLLRGERARKRMYEEIGLLTWMGMVAFPGYDAAASRDADATALYRMTRCALAARELSGTQGSFPSELAEVAEQGLVGALDLLDPRDPESPFVYEIMDGRVVVRAPSLSSTAGLLSAFAEKLSR